MESHSLFARAMQTYLQEHAHRRPFSCLFVSNAVVQETESGDFGLEDNQIWLSVSYKLALWAIGEGK